MGNVGIGNRRPEANLEVSNFNKRRLGAPGRFHEHLYDRGHRCSSAGRHAGRRARANGRAERRQPRGLPRARLWGDDLRPHSRRHVRPGSGELDRRGTGNKPQLQHDGHRHDYASGTKMTIDPVRQRRHRHAGAERPLEVSRTGTDAARRWLDYLYQWDRCFGHFSSPRPRAERLLRRRRSRQAIFSARY